jgi:hypothetical protein
VLPFFRERDVSDSELRYNFTCPKCSGELSITLDRIPPVRARFKCAHCKEPMDFPSRDEARVYVRLQQEGGAVTTPPGNSPEAPAGRPTASAVARATEADAGPPESARFRIEKPGFLEADIYDRRGLRNLIRTGEVLPDTLIRIDEAEPVRAGSLGFLQKLYRMRETSIAKPPRVCRTHTDRVAFYICRTDERPLCEECAPEKKFGGQSIRVCGLCGGNAGDLDQSSLIA